MELEKVNLFLPQKIVWEALSYLGVRYEYGSKKANSLDFFKNVNSSIDCSGFVVKVYNKVIPNCFMVVDQSGSGFLRETPLFVDVAGTPQVGDLISWIGHVGIVVDPIIGQFIGAQSSTGVALASYTTGHWADQKERKFRRWNGFVKNN